MPRKKLEETQKIETQAAEIKPAKRRGRPPKAETLAKRAAEAAQVDEGAAAIVRKIDEPAEPKPVKRRGRPPKAETLARKARKRRLCRKHCRQKSLRWKFYRGQRKTR